MRDIQFRGVSVESGEWVFGYFDLYGEIAYINTKQNTYEVHPESVGQWTGLVDKNGVRIFEGDILMIDNLFFLEPSEERIGCVVWDSTKGMFNISCEVDCPPNSNWEIIGNSFFNKELLK